MWPFILVNFVYLFDTENSLTWLNLCQFVKTWYLIRTFVYDLIQISFRDISAVNLNPKRYCEQISVSVIFCYKLAFIWILLNVYLHVHCTTQASFMVFVINFCIKPTKLRTKHARKRSAVHTNENRVSISST